MKTALLSVAAIGSLTGCLGPMSSRSELGPLDLNRHSSRYVGQRVTVIGVGIPDLRQAGLWESLAVRNHNFSVQRDRYCVRLIVPEALRGLLQETNGLRVTGVLRVAEPIPARALECGSGLAIEVETIVPAQVVGSRL